MIKKSTSKRAWFIYNSSEESPGSLNSRFAWETQVSVRARTVPQKRRILCEAPKWQALSLARRARTIDRRRRMLRLLSDSAKQNRNTHRSPNDSTVIVQRRGKSSPLKPWGIRYGKPRLAASLNLQEGAISVP